MAHKRLDLKSTLSETNSERKGPHVKCIHRSEMLISFQTRTWRLLCLRKSILLPQYVLGMTLKRQHLFTSVYIEYELPLQHRSVQQVVMQLWKSPAIHSSYTAMQTIDYHTWDRILLHLFIRISPNQSSSCSSAPACKPTNFCRVFRSSRPIPVISFYKASFKKINIVSFFPSSSFVNSPGFSCT
jgi:hypothetical protein